ncbi:MAG: hypothetical protein ABSD75_31780 [Terriglobales bacterium]|jgi:hypothetical protein
MSCAIGAAGAVFSSSLKMQKISSISCGSIGRNAEDWSPVVLPTLKYATPKHYRYVLDVHLIPAFGKRQIRDITREELQGFLRRKLGGGLSWETVHHFKCGLSKILGAAEDWGYIAENLAQKTKLPRRHYRP